MNLAIFRQVFPNREGHISRKPSGNFFIVGANLDMFAWSSYEVSGVDSAFIVHKLNVDPLVPPKKQITKRSMKPHVEAMKEKVEKLKRSGAIKEVFFLEWLANMVVVKKKNGKWRVCVDFTC